MILELTTASNIPAAFLHVFCKNSKKKEKKRNVQIYTVLTVNVHSTDFTNQDQFIVMVTIIYPHSGHGLIQAGSPIKMQSSCIVGFVGSRVIQSGYRYLILCYAQIFIILLSLNFVEIQYKTSGALFKWILASNTLLGTVHSGWGVNEIMISL